VSVASTTGLIERLRRRGGAVDPHPLARPDGYYDDDRSDVLPLVPTTARTYLDVGAARGQFGRLLRQARPVAFAAAVEPEPVEIDPRSYEVVYQTTFPLPATQAAGLPPIDCVSFNDVLEHMTDPWAALRQARELLSSRGVVVVSIPNVHNLATLFDLLGRGDWPYAASGVLDVDHVRFFTARSGRRLLEACGLTVEAVHHLDPLPLPRPVRTAARPLLEWRACGYRRVGFRARLAGGDR
jgi:SAM-dependent methyltransferase